MKMLIEIHLNYKLLKLCQEKQGVEIKQDNDVTEIELPQVFNYARKKRDFLPISIILKQ